MQHCTRARHNIRHEQLLIRRPPDCRPPHRRPHRRPPDRKQRPRPSRRYVHGLKYFQHFMQHCTRATHDKCHAQLLIVGHVFAGRDTGGDTFPLRHPCHEGSQAEADREGGSIQGLPKVEVEERPQVKS